MKARSKWAAVRFLLTTVSLMLGWLLFTWSLDLGSLIAGLSASIAVSAFTYSIFIDEQEVARRAHFPRIHMFVVFVAVLIFNMYVASFDVLWQIIRGRIKPGIIHFRTRLRTDIARVALTHSITLTPGTVTVLLEDDHLIVHWLQVKTTHSRYAGKLIKGTYEELLRRVWL